jgi:hypothetical protein
MTEKSTPQEPFSLSRWSRRKLEATAEASAPPSAAESLAPVNTMAIAAPSAPAPPAAPELPSVDSLNFHSDFTAFLRPEVDEKLKRAALKKLFRDPRFNVMDGLDTYIDDYTKADPIAPDVLKDLMQRFSMATAPASPSSPGDAPADEVPPATGAAGETPPAAAPLPAASAKAAPATEDTSEESTAPRSPS